MVFYYFARDDFHDDYDSPRSPAHSGGYRDELDDFGSPTNNSRSSPGRQNSYSSSSNTRKVSFPSKLFLDIA